MTEDLASQVNEVQVAENLDAIPDLSDVQVIVKVNYPGQSPQVVEDQVTFPLTSALMSVPGAQTVRGYSFYTMQYYAEHFIVVRMFYSEQYGLHLCGGLGRSWRF